MFNSSENIKTQDKIAMLEDLLSQASEITVQEETNSTFRIWKDAVRQFIATHIGIGSEELRQFNKLKFYSMSFQGPNGESYEDNNRRQFREDFKALKFIMENAINKFKRSLNNNTPVAIKSQSTGPQSMNTQSKLNISSVFISHSAKDSEFVEDIVNILECIGLKSNQIFCTSFEGYGIGLGENFLDAIKDKLSSDSLVIFVLSEHFYSSPICLCEMGAAWALTKDHIPVLIPPFDYADVKGVFPLTQGMKINEPLKLTLLKEKIEKAFSLQSNGSSSVWERKRDNIIDNINRKIGQ